MVHVIARTEPIENKPLDPFGGPQLRGVTGSLRAQSEELDDRSKFLGRELRGPARTRLATQSRPPFRLRRSQPLTDGRTTHAQLPCDFRLSKALTVQREGLEPSVFKRGSISAFNHAGMLSRKASNVK